MIDLPADLVDKAFKELGETPEVRSATLIELRSKLQNLPPNERPQREDDEFLLAFLRPRKFRVDAALKKMQAYTRFKNQHADILRNMRADDFRELYDQGFMRIQQQRDQEGRHVLLLFPGKLQPISRPDLHIMLTIFSLEQMGTMFDPYMQVNGVVMVENLAGFTLRNALKAMYGNTRKAHEANHRFLREACPYRLKGILIVNEPRYVDILLAMSRPFLQRKLLERIHLLGRGPAGLAALHTMVSPAHLPPDFGGSLAEPPGQWLEEAERMEQEGAMNKVL